MGSRVWRYVVIGGVLVALVVLVVALSAGGGGDDGGGGERSFHEVFQEWESSREMSDVMREEAITGAEEEEFVKKVLAGQAVKSAEASRWIGTNGKALVGAVVHLHLAQPISLRSVEVPAWVTPGPNVPNNPPIPLRRRALYTGTGIDELEVRLTMPQREALEIVPYGDSVDPPKLTMSVGRGYKKVGEHSP